MPLAQIENARKNEIRHDEIRRCQTQQRDVAPAAALAFAGTAFSVTGVPIARGRGARRGGLGWRITTAIKLGVAHQVAWRSRQDSNL
jgi:hypothetical protein